MSSSLKPTLGIDIGGSSIKAVVKSSGAGKARESGGDGGNGGWCTAQSLPYTNPTRSNIVSAIKECLVQLNIEQASTVGLCLPGKMNPDQTAIEFSTNLPALNDWFFTDLLASIFDQSQQPSFKIVSDATAAAYDYATDHPIPGRTAALSLGTGVGLCVLDASEPITIGTTGLGHIGHIGDMDIGRFGGADRFTNAGTRNTPESYFGAEALQRWSIGPVLNLSSLTKVDPVIQALVQTLRIIHAIYLPNRIVLLGGVGLAFKPHQNLITKMVNHQLTQLADPNWTLEMATTSHHAAQGAAKLAVQDF